MQKSKILIPVLTIAVVASGFALTTSRANAFDMSTGKQSLITKIAQKFNLNESDVRTVFEQQRTERQAERRQIIEDKLSQAVTSGKITEAQKSAILKKMSERDRERPEPGSMAAKTAEERESMRSERQKEMESWLKDNGLSLETFHDLVGQPERGFGGSRRGYMNN